MRMDDFDFSEDEIREQLEILGYQNVPEDRLQEFKKDLEQLVRHERSNTSNSTVDAPSSRPVAQAVHHSTRPTAGSIHVGRPVVYSSVDAERHAEEEGGRPSIHIPSVAPLAYNEQDTSLNTTSSTERRMMKRKVLRKIDGQSQIFDESTVTETSESDDVSSLQERLRVLPVGYNPRPTTAPSAGRHRQQQATQRPRTADGRRSRSEEPPVYRLSEDFEGPKALIKPMSKPPHERNLRKNDPVSRYQRYNSSWKSQRAPGEKSHKNLRWGVREQMLYHDQVVSKKQHPVGPPNAYVVPTDKSRKSLRWQVRNDLAQGLMPPSILD